jgi:hypothetical protein
MQHCKNTITSRLRITQFVSERGRCGRSQTECISREIGSSKGLRSRGVEVIADQHRKHYRAAESGIEVQTAGRV